VQFELAEGVDDGMTGVVTSLEADDHIRRLMVFSPRRGQVVYHPAFAFIAPLGAYDGGHGHSAASLD
jgi:hypothetical protein